MVGGCRGCASVIGGGLPAGAVHTSSLGSCSIYLTLFVAAARSTLFDLDGKFREIDSSYLLS